MVLNNGLKPRLTGSDPLAVTIFLVLTIDVNKVIYKLIYS